MLHNNCAHARQQQIWIAYKGSACRQVLTMLSCIAHFIVSIRMNFTHSTCQLNTNQKYSFFGCCLSSTKKKWNETKRSEKTKWTKNDENLNIFVIFYSLAWLADGAVCEQLLCFIHSHSLWNWWNGIFWQFNCVKWKRTKENRVLCMA